MRESNLKLKAKIILKFGTIIQASRAFEMREDRLSRVIHRRVVPKAEEKRTICLQLKKNSDEIFGE